MDFNAASWATELFGLRGATATDKLKRYLHLKEVKDAIPAFDTLSHAEQLDKATHLAAEVGGQHIEQLLKCMEGIDIQTASSQPEDSAKVVIELFKQGRTHAMPVWRGQAAAQNLSRFLGCLGLAPEEQDSLPEAIVSVCLPAHILKVTPAGVDKLNKVIHDQFRHFMQFEARFPP